MISGMLKLKLRITPRAIQIALGLLWLLDGVLQLQPKMFTSAFATQVVEPAAQGQPFFVSDPMHWGISLFLSHPAIFNSLFALTQLMLGALILNKRTTRVGLYLSVGWALIVWSVGEGYSGMFSGQTSLLMGAPGAAILYGLLALAVLPKKENGPHGQKIAYWLALVWLFVWVAGGAFQMLPKQGDTSDIGAMITANADGAPSWMASIDNGVGGWFKSMGPKNVQVSSQSMDMSTMQMNTKTTTTTQDNGYLLVMAFWLIATGIGFGVLKKGFVRNISIALGIGLSLFFWVVGQSMGTYFTGTATDPNSGPLFVMLGIAILGCADLDQQLSKLGQRIEYSLIGKPQQNGKEIVEPWP